MSKTPTGTTPRIPHLSEQLIEKLDKLYPAPFIEPDHEPPSDRELLSRLAVRGLIEQLHTWLNLDKEKGLHV